MMRTTRLSLTTKAKHRIIFILVTLFLIFWIGLLFFHSPKDIVNFIGVNNGYMLAFLVSLIGGAAFVTSTSMFTTNITLAVGGLSIVWLSFLSGIGVTIGDSFVYYYGSKGRASLSDKNQKRLDKFSAWLEKAPSRLVPIAIFLYAGFTPFPNEVLSIGLALADYPFRRAMPLILIGNMVLIAIITYLSVQGIVAIF